MPAKNSSQKEKSSKPWKADPPITVGGGGGRLVKRRLVPYYMEIIFDHGVLIDPDNKGCFITPNLTLDYVRINNAHVPVNANSKIVIKYQRGLLNWNITINGGPFGVCFKTAHLPYDFVTKKHYAEDLEFKKLTIDGREVPVLARPYKIEVYAKPTKARNKKR